MKRKLFLFAAGIAISGCSSQQAGTGACAGPQTGTWNGTTVSDKLTVDAACDYSYTGPDGCQDTGKYGGTLGTSGSTTLTISASTGGACAPAGNYTCTYTITGTSMTINCGAGNFSYTKQ